MTFAYCVFLMFCPLKRPQKSQLMLICPFLNKKFCVTKAIVISLKLAVDACPEQSHVWKKKCRYLCGYLCCSCVLHFCLYTFIRIKQINISCEFYSFFFFFPPHSLWLTCMKNASSSTDSPDC